MRQVSATMVGAVVLASGAVLALGAGVMLPVLGGWWNGVAVGAGESGTEARRTEHGVHRGDAPHAEPESANGSESVPAAGASRSPRVLHSRLRAPVLTGAVAAAAEVPADVDLVLVVDDAAKLRESSVGAAATRFMLDAAGLVPTRQAWATLAGQLGWTEAETFDRLLGRRVVLVAAGLADSSSSRWALLSDVSLETDQRLKERLEASQRAIDKGHQILSIEKGKYELTSHRHVARTPGKSPGTTPALDTRGVGGGGGGGAHERLVTIVLGPSGRSELFDQMVSVLARGAERPLARSGVITAAATAGESQILLLARLGGADRDAGRESLPAATPDDRWAGFLALAAGRSQQCAAPLDPSREPCEFVSRVIYRDPERRDLASTITPTSDAVFRAMGPGSLLTVVQAAPVQQIFGDAARLLDTLRDVPLPEPAHALVAARQIVSIREVGRADAGASAPLAAVLALETTATEQIAPIIDGAISRFIGAREQQLGIVRPPPRDFGGRLPAVTRLLPLDLPDSTPLRLVVADPLFVTWSYPCTGAGTARGGGVSGPRHGWWLLSLTPAPPGLESLPERAHNEVAAVLAGADGAMAGDVRRWVWLATAAPAAIEKRLPSPVLLPDAGGFRSAMKRFEHIGIELSVTESGDIRGDLSVRLSTLPAEPMPR